MRETLMRIPVITCVSLIFLVKLAKPPMTEIDTSKLSSLLG